MDYNVSSTSPRESLLSDIEFDKDVTQEKGILSYDRNHSTYKILLFSLLALDLGMIIAGGMFFELFQAEIDAATRSFVPPIPSRYVTFEPNNSFVHADPGVGPTAWDELIPLGREFIAVDEPEKWGLDGGYPLKEGTELFSVSLFHQIHCLLNLKHVLMTLSKSQGGQHVTRALNLAPIHDHEHVTHCFEYLRLAIMCAGDLTLEKANVVDGVRTADFDGWGDTHKCRDWDTMYDFVYKHIAPNQF